MLSSQDTLYVNKGVYYFNDCTIQGETDYIFGDSAKAVFDDCNLVWAGYSTGAKAGYITAARGSMLFRNCTISNDNDLGNTVVAGYLGRHWGDSAKVIFADTKGMSTSTLVASDASGQSAYFADPSSLTGTAASVVTEAYVTTDTDYSNAQKYAEATEIKEQKVTNSTTLAATDVAGATYLGTWIPENYAFEEAETDETETSDTITATWDFQNATPSSITSVNIQGTTNTVASDVDGIELTVNAEVTNGKLQYNASGYAQYNNGTIIKVPVYAEGDVVTIVAYPGQYKYTVAGTAAEANETTYTAKASDVETGYIEIVATGGAYIYSITLVTTGTPSTSTTETTNYIKAIAAKTVAGDNSTFTAYLFATVSANDVNNIEKVGFIIAPEEYNTTDEMVAASSNEENGIITSGGSSTVYDSITYNNGTTITPTQIGGGDYATGLKITDISNSVNVYYTAYAVGKDGTTTYFNVGSVRANN
jgi:hypothetical protein